MGAQLQAVLFDLDDTLIDWSGFNGDYYTLEYPHFTAVHKYLTGRGFTLPHVDKLIDMFRDKAQASWAHGRETLKSPHMPTLLMEVLEACDLPLERIDQTTVISHYGWGKVEGTTVFPEVPETLQTLINAGIKIGIVTNAFQTMDMRDNELVAHDLLRYFPTCRFAAADVGFLKPHPVIFQHALACTGTKPETSVFVGDNLTADIAGANRIGMKTVWRDINPQRSRVTRGLIEPSATITRLDAILPHLDEWFPGWR